MRSLRSARAAFFPLSCWWPFVSRAVGFPFSEDTSGSSDQELCLPTPSLSCLLVALLWFSSAQSASLGADTPFNRVIYHWTFGLQECHCEPAAGYIEPLDAFQRQDPGTAFRNSVCICRYKQYN
ncbi:uncharacterized protein LAESUDRAFT_729618 [Laetiporus sulphureus 93-53]|uniref:Uncharacterized protein n=1 Tax=Laetiporus sulphureus 93-53 TaxID=1314785 RepID=A0A165CMY1_9APHY|nr:uncharacterized protein LAESUDRAFT_729618 [Laetiporus sulphureus 93-53]KZT03103.1 hypothetical protein LAESUDRAFT_729618 [Laetiporus sulphureus 93-53]